MPLRFLILILFTAGMLAAQTVDSTLTGQPADSIVVYTDSLAADSLAIQDSLKKEEDITAVIYAEASDSLSFDVTGKKMFVYGNGSVKYKESQLESGEIVADFVTNELSAKGVADTSDTTGQGLMQTPILTEGSQVYEGKRLKYNFKTQRGFISIARNNEKEQSYRGNKVKKVAQDTYFIEDGIYTTCDADTPHTHFSASQMKVIQNDKIFARWIFMHIAGIPLPIPLPFGVFPNQTGRRSGIIVPTYGEDAIRGGYFRDFGYFFALSDYYDLTLKGSYYTRGGYEAATRFRYKKRYDFDGNLDASFSNIVIGEDDDPTQSVSRDYKLRWRHNQVFNPSSRLDVNVTFQSGTYSRNNDIDYNDVLKKNITSNANFNKRFDEMGANLNLSYSRTQNLETGNINETLPSASFSVNTFYPFKSKNSDPRNQKWYEYISMNYNNRFRNTRNTTDGDLKVRSGFQQNLTVNASPKLGYFSITPSIRYQESWNPQYTTRQSQMFTLYDSLGQPTVYDSLVENKVDAITAVRTFSMSVGASTKLYGIAQPQMFGIEAFRHTLQPSISYNYNPDFSTPFWGYYQEAIDPQTGETVKYNKYEDELYGSVSASESQSLSFNVNNIFEVKTMKDQTDTTDTENKITLLNLGASINYNFASEFRKLSDLSLNYRTQIGNKLNFSGSTRYTFYNTVEGKQLNEFLSETGKGLMRITNLSLSLSTSLAGSEDKDEERDGVDRTNEEGEYEDGVRQREVDRNSELYYDGRNIRPNFSIPWNLSLSYRYNLGMNDPREERHTKSQTLGLNLGMNLTQNWKLTFNGSYDIHNKEFTTPQVMIYRDLHCWEMNMSWRPLGTYRGFNFTIRMKASQLQDIKVEKSQGFFSGR